MNAGESLSTPAQLVPPLFVRVHARTPSLHLSFPFSTPRCYVSPQGRWRTRGEPVFPRPVRTRLRANKWDETDDTAHIVLRHIPCQPGEDHALVIPCPPRVLRSPISTYPLGLQPLTGQTSVDSTSFHLLSSHSRKSSPLRLLFSSVRTQVSQKNVKILFYWIKDDIVVFLQLEIMIYNFLLNVCIFYELKLLNFFSIMIKLYN